MNAGPMINRCFRHQHPEAYGFVPAQEGDVPVGLRYGGGELPASERIISEEPMGDPEAAPLE